MSDMPEGDTESDERELVVFDHDNPEHYAALRAAGRAGLANRGGTERVIAELRAQGLMASVGTAFEALILAAEERDNRRPL